MTFGLDTNILCYALDPAFPENRACRKILLEASAENKVGINPTVVHETYHTLVFDQNWVPADARERILTVLQHPHVEFYNQSRRISTIALELAARHKLGGRDSLILASFIINKVPVLYSHDSDLVGLKRMSWKGLALAIEDPL